MKDFKLEDYTYATNAIAKKYQEQVLAETKTEDASVVVQVDYLEDHGFESATDYARFLMRLNPERYGKMKLKTYRGEMLCLTFSSVKYASTITATNEQGWKPYRGKKLKGVYKP